MISTSSFVMAAWRPRLYCMVNRLIMSDAFLDALSIALRLKRLCETSGEKRQSKLNDVPSTLLARVALDESSVNCVRERELREVLRHIILHFVCPEAS